MTGSSDSLFLVASFSGGGARASALSYGVLRDLARTPIVWEGYRKKLVDELNISNALSGGSFTAAYYVLYGDRLAIRIRPTTVRPDLFRSQKTAAVNRDRLIRGTPARPQPHFVEELRRGMRIRSAGIHYIEEMVIEKSMEASQGGVL